ncbi:11951_t:CDS:1, partial [Ambispora gerdemannii]
SYLELINLDITELMVTSLDVCGRSPHIMVGELILCNLVPEIHGCRRSIMADPGRSIRVEAKLIQLISGCTDDLVPSKPKLESVAFHLLLAKFDRQ